MDLKTKRLKYACYSANATMSVVATLSPVLFLTFRSLYGISFALMGLLVSVNFVTQLLVDLVFSFFSHKFNISKTVKSIPIFAALGFIIYAVWPFFAPSHVYAGLVIGTLFFSAASGLNEVLTSPVIAAIPSDDPDREMSKLHSVYAWGVVVIIMISTVFLALAGNENWQWLPIIFVPIPLLSSVLFAGSDIPHIETTSGASNALGFLKNKGVWLCVFAIFLGGAAECTMAQWSSSYLEQAFGIPKVQGDIFGVALFSLMLGLGRTIYSKVGKNIGKVLTLGVIGATICYFTAAVSNISWIGLAACALTGFCTSMLWPGNLVVASGRFPEGGVFIYAMMAAGGDLGASVSPQLLGVVTDAVISSHAAASFASTLNLSPEQLGMKIGMLCGMLFPLVGIFVYSHMWRQQKKTNSK